MLNHLVFPLVASPWRQIQEVVDEAAQPQVLSQHSHSASRDAARDLRAIALIDILEKVSQDLKHPMIRLERSQSRSAGRSRRLRMVLCAVEHCGRACG
ncbi:hypothetical protein CEP54_007599 [Fusarium duplospermum]|uniref:Uncharacterized protein n=1 Tax=Fusarium duplospermum TaxID=1325734 RepID=A0A428Q0W9_9HYPO|nr:hypothetical protein CEP54_007599 [Fusarium duplospermum]